MPERFIQSLTRKYGKHNISIDDGISIIVMVIVSAIVSITMQMVKADPNNYNQVFKGGYHNGSNFVFHHNLLVNHNTQTPTSSTIS